MTSFVATAPPLSVHLPAAGELIGRLPSARRMLAALALCGLTIAGSGAVPAPVAREATGGETAAPDMIMRDNTVQDPAAGSATQPGGTPSGGNRARTGAIVAGAAGLAVAGGALVVAGSDDATTPEDFGAAGDGVTDDTAALQEALDSVPAGGTLLLRPGATYLHSDVLTLRTPHVTVEGTDAVLTATREATSTFAVAADGVTVSGVTFTLTNSTKRWDGWDQTSLWITGNDVVVRDVRAVGAAAAGIAVGRGAGNFLLERVSVADSRADGIHITDGAHDGRVVEPVTTNTGDDGVAVVSYRKDDEPVERIRIESPRVEGTTWGRGISVVGGNDITYTDIDVRDTDAAGVYVGSEGDPYWTFPARGVLIEGGTVTSANENAEKDHGAVLVYSGNPGTRSHDITVRGLTISDTRASASWDVGVLAEGGADLAQVTFTDLSMTDGPQQAYWTNRPTAVRMLESTQDGQTLDARRGW